MKPPREVIGQAEWNFHLVDIIRKEVWNTIKKRE